MNRKLRSNIIFQTLYQILIVITPLITSPYVSRVLGAENLGVYSYTYSIANYFAIFAMLGTNTYGSKSIAIVRDNKDERSRVFSEIVTLQFVLAFISCASYVFYLTQTNRGIQVIAIIQILMIVACFFNINWLFWGLEEFKTTVFRNVVVKILTIVSIYCFVHSINDLWKYVMIMAGGETISQLMLFVMAKKHVRYRIPTFKGVLHHLKPNALLFMPGIAYAINSDLDKTMIGVFSTYAESGFYYNADKLIKIPTGVITGLGVVLLPHVTNLVATQKNSVLGDFLKRTCPSIMFITFAVSGGIAAVANEFVPVFFGNGYDKCIMLIQIMCVSMVLKAISDMIRTQYLIPNNMEKIYSTVVMIGAIINALLNLILIKLLGATGAAIATLISELLICVVYMITIQRESKFLNTIGKCALFLLPVIAMNISIWFIRSTVNSNLYWKLVVEILLGGMTYVIVGLPCLMLIDKNVVRLLKNKIIRK